MVSNADSTTHRLWIRFISGVAVVALLIGGSLTLSDVQSANPATSTSTTVTPRPALSLETIAFSSPTNGFGVFTEETLSGRTCRDFVGHSADGGAYFGSLVHAMSWNCYKNEFSSSLALDGHGDAFLYGPWLYVSHDNAKSWTRSPQPGAVLDVAAVGHSVWTIESICTHVEKVSLERCPVRLLESINGGRTWEQSRTVPPHLITGLLSDGANDQTYLVRTSRSAAYLMLAPLPNSHGATRVIPLWYTSNGGHTWSNRPVPCGIGALSAVLSAAPDGTLMAICAGQPSAGEQGKSVLESTNGGRTWVTKNRCLAPGTPSCSTSNIDFGYLGGIDLVTSSEAFIVGGRSSLQVTHDGGSRWQVVQPLIGGSAGGTGQVVFFDASHGVVLGQNDNNNEDSTLWSTVDGGKHWTALLPRIG